MNPFDKAIWDAERQIAQQMTVQEYQEAVQGAKVWMCQGGQANNFEISVRTGAVQVFMTQRNSPLMTPIDLDVAMVFLIRAYRLQKGLS